ncbi:unnamed protein product, partial [Ixodes pacificus]
SKRRPHTSGAHSATPLRRRRHRSARHIRSTESSSKIKTQFSLTQSHRAGQETGAANWPIDEAARTNAAARRTPRTRPTAPATSKQRGPRPFSPEPRDSCRLFSLYGQTAAPRMEKRCPLPLPDVAMTRHTGRGFSRASSRHLQFN